MGKKYQVAAVPGGFATASLTHTGFLVALNEYPTRDLAEAECRRLNLEWDRLQRREVADAAARRNTRKTRQLMRWFPTEETGL